jgi:cobaltochelatase CobN
LAGILCSYGQIVENNCAEIDSLIRCLEKHELLPLCVYCEGMTDSTLPVDRRYAWLTYLQDAGPGLVVLLNLLVGRLVSRPEDVSILERFNVPVLQIVRSYLQSPEDWKADFGGLGPGSQSMVFSLTLPEMSGSIEPTLVAGTVPEIDDGTGLSFRRYVPVEERIEHLCRRLKRWIRLRVIPNSEKRLTIVLHNNPCKGVEATLGLAAGLDTFDSLASFIRSLKEAGYNVGDVPEDGTSILNLLLDRKAISEFRWTTADEIVRKGGVLHQTTQDEYEALLAELPARARDRILDDWGPFPGEGMVYRDNGDTTLLVTGLRFGNLQIMVQPKRGCYGAKCNGEVCRILHDPELSPPHHWLATYRYIRDTSDAVLHFGAHGALEFLPGKRVALSDCCFPEITLDDLPNAYLYIMDAGGDGLVAKRRGRAVMVDHLTPVQRPAELDQETCDLEHLLDQYQKALENGESRRASVLRDEMLPLMKKLTFVDQSYEGDRFDETVALLSRQIARCKRVLTPQGMHRLGIPPGGEGIATMLATILFKPSDELPSLEEIATWAAAPTGNTFNDARDVIRSLMDAETVMEAGTAEATRVEGLKEWCMDVGGRIAMSAREIPQLLKALEGGFIEPGLCGSLSLGKTQALPTGRNFYTSDVLAMPTRAAWEVGKELADNLLRKFLKEEGRFPESVGISLWSLDAFKSDGEAFCQILHLMGMRPVWEGTGRVSRIEPIELGRLTLEVDGMHTMSRPRVDVVIQTSCILRDTVPHFADLVDEAAVTAGELDEPYDRNFIRKHTQERMAELKEELGKRLSEGELKRMASFRVFSSAPGTYGIGVGLALDASAWETDDDLAETFINWNGYAYGSDLGGQFSRVSGMEAHRLYAGNLKTLDVTYMRQCSPDYDMVDCGCYAGCLGGMSVAAKAVSGKRARLYWADTNAEGDLSVRDLKDDIAASVRTKLFSKNWIKHQREHGHKGAGDVSSRVNNLFKLSATTYEVEKWVFDSVVETYIRDRENLEWLRQNNPYALEEVTRRLLEAHSRGLWEADPDLLKDVQQAALLIEGDMEEIIGEVREEFQGAKVDVMTAKDVEKWNHKWKIDRVGS